MDMTGIRSLQTAFRALAQSIGQDVALDYVQKDLGYRSCADVPADLRQDVAALLTDLSTRDFGSKS